MNELKPKWNGWQYFLVFTIGFICDLIIHFFSKRKYNAIKAGNNQIFGFGASLMYYYHSFGEGLFKWIIPAMILGFFSVFVLLISDIILQIMVLIDESKA